MSLSDPTHRLREDQDFKGALGAVCLRHRADPTNEPGLMSASVALTTPTATALSASTILSSAPSRDLTRKTGLSMRSIVPRTRTGGASCDHDALKAQHTGVMEDIRAV